MLISFGAHFTIFGFLGINTPLNIPKPKPLPKHRTKAEAPSLCPFFLLSLFLLERLFQLFALAFSLLGFWLLLAVCWHMCGFLTCFLKATLLLLSGLSLFFSLFSFLFSFSS